MTRIRYGQWKAGLLAQEQEQAVTQCRYIIRKLAVQAYHKLPNEHRTMLSIQDLEQEGIVTLLNALPAYDGRRSKLSSFGYTVVHNYYVNRCQYAWQPKRKCTERENISAGRVMGGQICKVAAENCSWELFQTYRQVYEGSSPALQRVLALCIGIPVLSGVPAGGVKRGRNFDDAREVKCEFLRLCRQTGFTFDAARSIARGQASDYVAMI